MTLEPLELPKVAHPKIGLTRQVLVCVVMSTLALALLYMRRSSIWTIFTAGQSMALQVGFGLAIGASSASMAWIAYSLQRSNSSTKSVVTSYSRLDLGGWNPILLSFAAGIGEELLFRAALQPVLGMVLTSLIFVAAHVRAYQMKALTRTTLTQAISLFASSIFLGVIFQYIGLIAAILVHILIDIAGLYSVRYAVAQASGSAG
ncbi:MULTISPECIES: CPBP family intramembrane glutamic endopeptidase [unclassified Dyella]|uniref:CPBP family intramembrane glutamic endopeptidase n=1 Tax=unclassified Dyella TaxID=2634549 RepID=UPI003F8EE747